MKYCSSIASHAQRDIPFSRRPTLPAPQDVHDEADEADAVLDLPTGQGLHCVLLWYRLVSLVKHVGIEMRGR